MNSVIDAGRCLSAVTFSANGECLWTGDDNLGVRTWRVENGEQMAKMKAWPVNVQCVAVSKDGRWVATGSEDGDVFLWDAKTPSLRVALRGVAARGDGRTGKINGVDFSPDSSRLVSATNDRTASIWDVATHQRVQTLQHKELVTAAKYSPQGDRIATATPDSIRVWDSNNGRSLVHIPVTVTRGFHVVNANTFVWFNNNLFVISDSQIKQIEASTGSALSEWPVSAADGINLSCIALPKHARIIACSTRRTITVFDTATHTQLGFVHHPQDIRSILVSPDDQSLAIVGDDGKIAINSLSHISVSILSCSIVVHMNNFLAPIVFHRIQTLGLVYTPHSRNQTFGSTTLRSILGSTINSQPRKHY